MRIVLVGPPSLIDAAVEVLDDAGLAAALTIPTATQDGAPDPPAVARMIHSPGSTVVFLGIGSSIGGVSLPLEDLPTHVRSMERSLARSGPDGGDERLSRLEDRVERLTSRLAKSQEELHLERLAHRILAGRRSVRLATRLADRLRPVILGVRSLKARLRPTSVSGSRPSRIRSFTRDEVVESIAATRSTQYPTSGPLVSIVMLTRDGADHLRVVLPALAATAYRSFELIVVDNGSSDETADILGAEWSFPLTVIRNERNATFSYGNNQGAARASGEFLLFLNNDIEPITDGWLGAMVAAAIDGEPKPSAVGALLVYPAVGDLAKNFSVQHRGVAFGFRKGAPHAFNLPGDDPTDPALAGMREMPAATAAALLIPRTHYEQVGGFAGGYVYGADDIDLCLRLRALGPIVVQGDAVLFHHESATQAGTKRHLRAARHRANWELYADTWGPSITRSVLRDRLSGAGRWTGEAGRPMVAITLTHDDESKRWGDYHTAHQLGEALAMMGWDVHYAQRHGDDWYDLPDGVVLVIGLLDAFDVGRIRPDIVKVAWVRNWVERWIGQPWFGSYDAVVVGSGPAADAIRAATVFDPTVFPLAADPGRFAADEAPDAWSADYAFTGHRWGEDRSITSLIDVRPGERFALYGKGWEGDRAMKPHWRGVLDYAALPALYRSVPIVLDDTAGPTKDHGFLNSRVFDALAAGALVLTDNRVGSEEVFDGLLPVYDDAASLRTLLDRYLGDEPARRQLVERLREIVLERHTFADRAEQLLGAVAQTVEAPRVAVKIGAPDWDVAHRWGDLHYARSLIRSLAPWGIRGEIHVRDDWDAADRQAADIVVHLRGLTDYRPKPGALNVLWVISHPDEVTPEEARRFDLICVASPVLAETLAADGVSTLLLPQATDATTFGRGTPDADLRTEVLFVGNTRNQRRAAVEWALEAGLPLTVYGQGWDGRIPSENLAGGYFPNERLPDLYASAKVVLNDHWPDMRESGIVSNRILDVLAAGGVVVSDPVLGLDEMLDGAVPVYRDAGGLAQVVRELLGDPDRRAELARRGRATVMGAHTFDHRARQLVDAMRPLLTGRQLDCDGTALRLPEVQPPVE